MCSWEDLVSRKLLCWFLNMTKKRRWKLKNTFCNLPEPSFNYRHCSQPVFFRLTDHLLVAALVTMHHPKVDVVSAVSHSKHGWFTNTFNLTEKICTLSSFRSVAPDWEPVQCPTKYGHNFLPASSVTLLNKKTVSARSQIVKFGHN